MPKITKPRRDPDARIKSATSAHASRLSSGAKKGDCSLVECSPLSCKIKKLPPGCDEMRCGQGCTDQVSCDNVSLCANVAAPVPKN